MIKLIIFDIGGVVGRDTANHSFAAVTQFLKIKKTKLLNVRENNSKLVNLVTLGKISLFDLYHRIKKELGAEKVNTKKILAAHLRGHTKYAHIKNKQLVRLVISLKKQYQVVCLSNTEPEIYEINKKHRVFDYFHQRFISTQMHMMKPEPRIFKTVLTSLKIKPAEAVFIDDNIKYIKAANKMGIHAIWYKNMPKLKKTLIRLSVNVK